MENAAGTGLSGDFDLRWGPDGQLHLGFQRATVKVDNDCFALLYHVDAGIQTRQSDWYLPADP
jgi:hypothetical protein